MFFFTPVSVLQGILTRVHFYLGILLRVKPNTTAVPVGTSICAVVLLLIHTAQVPASPCPYEPHMVVGNEHVEPVWPIRTLRTSHVSPGRQIQNSFSISNFILFRTP